MIDRLRYLCVATQMRARRVVYIAHVASLLRNGAQVAIRVRDPDTLWLPRGFIDSVQGRLGNACERTEHDDGEGRNLPACQ